MMDTDFSLILALILFIVLIVFDLAFYRYRKNHAADDRQGFPCWPRMRGAGWQNGLEG